MVAVAAEAPLLGSQEPRIRRVPDGDDHPRWDEIEDFVGRLEIGLDEWQWDVLRASLLRRGELWASFAIAVCCPRQNGKNLLLEVRELAGAYLGLDVGTNRTTIHSAHLADTSMEGFNHLDDLIDAHDWLSKEVKHIRRQNGHEQIRFRNGGRIRFRTRTKGGGRGFSAPLVIFDETMFLSETSMGSILPVVSAQPDPQIWYTGSAVDQMIHEDGVVFARIREQGLGRSAAVEEFDDRLAYFEWSLPYDDPAEVPDEVLRDPQSVAATNPAYGRRIRDAYIRSERVQLAPRTLAVERLGVGDWPRTDGVEETPLPYAEWARLNDESSVLQPPVVFAFDVSPDRSAAVAVAGRRADGLLVVEISDHHQGTRWLPSRLAQLWERYTPEAIVCDGDGPAGSLIAALEDADVPVTLVPARERAQACSRLVDLVRERGLRHLGSGELAAAVRGARARPLGDAWVWSRKASTVDISPLVAATLALSAATLLPDSATDIQIF